MYIRELKVQGQPPGGADALAAQVGEQDHPISAVQACHFHALHSHVHPVNIPTNPIHCQRCGLDYLLLDHCLSST